VASLIAVVGSTNWDMTMTVPTLPLPGETVLSESCGFSLGGKGANQAVAAARMGGSVSFFTCVGDDTFADSVRRQLYADGVAVEGIMTIPGVNTGQAFIIVDETGENLITVAAGANRCFEPRHLTGALSDLAQADILLLQLEIPLPTVTQAARMAASQGVRVILNPAPFQPIDETLLGYVNILTPNEVEMARMSGRDLSNRDDLQMAAETLLRGSIEAVLITLGRRGVFLATAAGSELIPAFEVGAVDTTGAGDAFNGTLAVALAEHNDLPRAVTIASAAAALAVTKRGAVTSIPRLSEVMRFLASRPGRTEGIK